MKKLFVGSLPHTTTEESLQALFSGNCKRFGFIEMEGHEARAAIAGLDGKSFEGNLMKVKYEEQRGKGHKGKRRMN